MQIRPLIIGATCLLFASVYALAQLNNPVSTIACSVMPALTGVVTTSAGSCNAAMAAGAAATNIGTLGGDFTGTLPNPNVVGMTRRLCKISGASMSVTTDQACTVPASIVRYAIIAIWFNNCSGTVGLSAGGFYTATSKGGTNLVLSAQTYAGLTASTVILNPTIISAILTTQLTATPLYFSLTTAGNAVTCDVSIQGIDLT